MSTHLSSSRSSNQPAAFSAISSNPNFEASPGVPHPRKDVVPNFKLPVEERKSESSGSSSSSSSPDSSEEASSNLSHLISSISDRSVKNYQPGANSQQASAPLKISLPRYRNVSNLGPSNQKTDLNSSLSVSSRALSNNLPVMTSLLSPQPRQSKIGISPEQFDFTKSSQYDFNVSTMKIKQLMNVKRRKSVVQKIFDRMTSINKGDEGKGCGDRMIVSTASGWYQAWRIANILLSFFSSFYYAYFASFMDSASARELESFSLYNTVFQLLFTADVLLNFFTEHHYATSNEVERDLFVIFRLYVTGRFGWDLVTIVPFHTLLSSQVDPKYAKLLYYVKLIRLHNGFELMDHKIYMKQVKDIFNNRMQKLIEQQRELADSQLVDSTHIGLIVLISYFMRTFQLVVILLCTSYFFGVLFYILCELTAESPLNDSEQSNFIETFQIDAQDNPMKMITMTYFSFTSLSTVGLGDLHPRSNIERFYGAFMLLFGVAITSFIMENFVMMIVQIREFSKGFEQSKELAQFFGTLLRFNSDKPISESLQKSMEDYFNYRWRMNKNNAISTQEDVDLFVQLPWMVRTRIYTEFLHKEFARVYSRYFSTIRRINHLSKSLHFGQSSKLLKFGRKATVFSEADQCVLDFQTAIMRHLEPQLILPQTVIYGQFQFVDQITIILDGKFEVGYNHEFLLFKEGLESASSIQLRKVVTKKTKQKNFRNSKGSIFSFLEDEKPAKIVKFHYPLTFEPGLMFGLIETVFSRRTQFIYRAGLAKANSLFIRRANWRAILEASSSIESTVTSFKKTVLTDYVNKIYLPIQDYQQKAIEAEQTRKMQDTAKSEMMRKERIAHEFFVQSNSSNHLHVGQTYGKKTAKPLEPPDNPLIEKNAAGKGEKDQVFVNLFKQRLKASVEAQFERKETELMKVITWKDEIQDPDLKKLVDLHFPKLQAARVGTRAAAENAADDDGNSSATGTLSSSDTSISPSVSSMATNIIGEEAELFNAKQIKKVFSAFSTKMGRIEEQICKLLDENCSLKKNLRLEKRKVELLEEKVMKQLDVIESHKKVQPKNKTQIIEEEKLAPPLTSGSKLDIQKARIQMYLPETDAIQSMHSLNSRRFSLSSKELNNLIEMSERVSLNSRLVNNSYVDKLSRQSVQSTPSKSLSESKSKSDSSKKKKRPEELDGLTDLSDPLLDSGSISLTESTVSKIQFGSSFRLLNRKLKSGETPQFQMEKTLGKDELSPTKKNQPKKPELVFEEIIEKYRGELSDSNMNSDSQYKSKGAQSKSGITQHHASSSHLSVNNPSSYFPEGSISQSNSNYLNPFSNDSRSQSGEKKFNIFKPNFVMKLGKKPTRGESSRVFSHQANQLFDRQSSKVPNTPKAGEEESLSFASLGLKAVSQQSKFEFDSSSINPQSVQNKASNNKLDRYIKSESSNLISDLETPHMESSRRESREEFSSSSHSESGKKASSKYGSSASGSSKQIRIPHYYKKGSGKQLRQPSEGKLRDYSLLQKELQRIEEEREDTALRESQVHNDSHRDVSTERNLLSKNTPKFHNSKPPAYPPPRKPSQFSNNLVPPESIGEDKPLSPKLSSDLGMNIETEILGDEPAANGDAGTDLGASRKTKRISKVVDLSLKRL